MSLPPFLPTSVLVGRPGRDGSNVLPTETFMAESVTAGGAFETALSAAIAGQAGSSLTRWKTKLALDPANCVIVGVGDSTSDEGNEARAFYKTLRNLHATSNLGYLNGMDPTKILSRGHSGSTRAAYFVNATWKNQLITDDPDLIIYSLGINDVRDGSTSETQLRNGIISDVDWLRANCPNADIVLRVPNSFTTDDVSSNGFVTPNGSAQAYTDIMREAYLGLVGRWPNVVVWNTQDAIFGRVCRPSTASRLMKDQVHPSEGVGYPLIADGLAQLIGHERVMPRSAIDMRLAGQATYPYVLGDLVDRADANGAGAATSGQAWSGGSQLLKSLSGRLAAVSPISFGVARETINTSQADAEAGVTISKVDTAAQGGLVFRWIDGNNFCLFHQSGGGYALVTRHSGVTTTQFTVLMPVPVDGDRIRVLYRGSLIYCFVNDVFLGGGDFTGAINTTGTQVGIQTSSLNTRFVDVWCRRLPWGL